MQSATTTDVILAKCSRSDVIPTSEGLGPSHRKRGDWNNEGPVQNNWALHRSFRKGAKLAALHRHYGADGRRWRSEEEVPTKANQKRVVALERESSKIRQRSHTHIFQLSALNI